MQKFKKLFAIFFLSLLFLGTGASMTNSHTVYAEINHDYGETGNKLEDGVMDEETEDGVSLIGLLATFVVTIARLFATLIAWLIHLIGHTTEARFPYADQIIFNTIPVLDCNFINPAEGSLLKDSSGYTPIGEIIRNIYFTGLSIGLGFMGIVVAVMAIKLAISSIGSQKAKYKEAIVTWATALVLLFGMHYLIAMLFFLNEKLVEVASTIVTSATENANLQIGSNNPRTNGVVSGLGDFFYEKAIGNNTGLLGAFKTKPIPAALYLMFIVQSVFFLFSYFKRFFYVIILSLLAPYVVIYDFFKKAIGI